MNFTHTPDIVPFENRIKYKQLDSHQLNTLKHSVYQILERTGVYFPLEEALNIFEENGADVNRKTQIVKIPATVIEKALKTLPSAVVLGGREERFDLILDGSKGCVIPNSCGVFFMDLETGEKRNSYKSDVEQLARVFDALPHVCLTRPIIAATDKGVTNAVHECQALLTNSLKHARGATSMHPKLVPFILEMAQAIRGSEAEHRKRPIVNANICTLAPLGMDTHSLECALFYARSGIPQSMMAMPCMASTAPATVLGAVALGEAEIIALMTLLQLAVSGAPLIHCNLVGQMDPVHANNILDVGEPAGHIVVQMAREVWGLPSLGGVLSCMTADKPGWESGFIDGQSAAMMSLAGPDLPGFMGLLGESMIVYPEQIILAHEAIQRAYDMLYGFKFNEDDIALDVIESVGPRKHFLLSPHTAKGLRKLRHSPILRKKGPDKKLIDPKDVAKEIYQKIVAEHTPEPLPEDVLMELDRIVAAADEVGKTIK
ncbi:MAG: hypothetical protein HOC09_29145 [Deltaproteobacteria bacterium]|jgi:trimethylamine---corrinoid protein Co-methyltransferase|nr:hypothetical protein [Deltaproteobacteria bacterium]